MKKVEVSCMKYIKNINTKIGNISIIEEDKKLIEYLEGSRKKIDVPLNPKGTKFMKLVWTTLQGILYGEIVKTVSRIRLRIEVKRIPIEFREGG